jgi:hypothetical protein
MTLILDVRCSLRQLRKARALPSPPFRRWRFPSDSTGEIFDTGTETHS